MTLRAFYLRIDNGDYRRTLALVRRMELRPGGMEWAPLLDALEADCAGCGVTHATMNHIPEVEIEDISTCAICNMRAPWCSCGQRKYERKATGPLASMRAPRVSTGTVQEFVDASERLYEQADYVKKARREA